MNINLLKIPFLTFQRQNGMFLWKARKWCSPQFQPIRLVVWISQYIMILISGVIWCLAWHVYGCTGSPRTDKNLTYIMNNGFEKYLNLLEDYIHTEKLCFDVFCFQFRKNILKLFSSFGLFIKTCLCVNWLIIALENWSKI